VTDKGSKKKGQDATDRKTKQDAPRNRKKQNASRSSLNLREWSIFSVDS